MRRHRAVWTEERETQLRKLREQGFSSSQIAVKLGLTTRNAVIGAAHRMGLCSTKRAAAPRAIRKPRIQRHTPFRMPIMKTEPLPTMDQQSDAPVTLLDLEPHHCRWPVSDAPYTFCGGTKQDGSSYCRYHDSIARRGVAA